MNWPFIIKISRNLKRGKKFAKFLKIIKYFIGILLKINSHDIIIIMFYLIKALMSNKFRNVVWSNVYLSIVYFIMYPVLNITIHFIT